MQYFLKYKNKYTSLLKLYFSFMIANTKFKHMNYQFRSDSQKIILTKRQPYFWAVLFTRIDL